MYGIDSNSVTSPPPAEVPPTVQSQCLNISNSLSLAARDINSISLLRIYLPLKLKINMDR